ncbi:MAG: hypothetical protein AB7I32_01845 [Gammaproteobacteria bacterium]
MTAGIGLNVAGSRTDTSITEFGRFGIIEDPFGVVGFNSFGRPSPFLEAVVDIDAPANTPLISAGSSGLLNYFVEIVSPISMTTGVAIDVNGAVTGAASASSFDATFSLESSWALFESATSGVQLARDIIRTDLRTGTHHDSFSRTVVVNLQTNHVYRVTLVASARADVRAGHDVEAVAWIDPVFTFAPGVDLSLVSFSFSDGIGNSPIPLPSSLALLCSSLLAAGPLMRRSRARHR